MMTRLLFALVLAAVGLGGAQNPLEEMLRKAVVQEETGQNLDAAIKAYQAVLTQFGEERKIAATALFRLAESYRKQGKKDQALASYERLVREFSDQAKLAEQSKKVLAETFKTKPGSAGERGKAAAELEAAYAQRVRELEEQRARSGDPAAAAARQRYRTLLEEQIKLMEQTVSIARREYGLGAIPWADVLTAQMQLLELQRDLVALDSGTPEPSKPGQPGR